MSDKMPERAQVLLDLEPTSEFFVGIDSDGCAMDAMDIKHYECFTPSYIKGFDLQAASTLVRETALFVNLYSTTRGTNRWVALSRLFDLLRDRPEVKERGVEVPQGDDLKAFLDSGYPRSDAGIANYAAAGNVSPEIQKCIEWGDLVNKMIAFMVKNAAPFPGAREAMEEMQEKGVDQLVVSATPLEALDREWNEHGLAQYMKVIAGQEMGSKADHIRYAAKGKYKDNHIMLIGDAPGDRDAAFSEGVLWYPILPGKEKESWARFREEALDKFLNEEFEGEYQQKLVDEYNALLPELPDWPTFSGNNR
ncbi:HAD family hydrolase [Corynebacterium cystitidis]|uniref:Haloacid dehalogenase-like hydrolase n=1 Tax=Corynebacterium cystitidis DSM 20524 TaxID=1121357 RepID=A0A1H9V4B6_9CORY|nr:HAD hydrolase-like protein [Corynebacterium cystitidis]WJY83350.1 hypothetical protein CCYS_12315 [Corynebacterium cystitidis DSM 20524]SES16565.1 Haloacid dehalogenase-like hydrolase [Corynebacterium cystitidis DSM 20524]SNV62895.1 Uncharacterised protein [Corynebacterium cystitidis]